jgi:16S rRNA (adenine(1408)-N(1))-methyltransferase
VLLGARSEPTRLFLGVDPYQRSMRDAARRAARRSALPNAVFVVSSVEQLPEDLSGVADAVSITFPWGSLLQGSGEPGSAILRNIARICAPGATVTVLWSVIQRDHLIRDVGPARVSDAFGLTGFHVHDVRTATIEEIRSTRSSWAKRLKAGSERVAHILIATRT